MVVRLINEVTINMDIKNKYLSKYACLDSDAIYKDSLKGDIRTSFYHDIDKIIYSLSFARYMDKTQVYSYKNNDHLTKRMLHVLFVSKIARTISRALRLNEDLTEAIALGHDLGHVPFGHFGESVLSKISIEHNLGAFNHNIHSARLLMSIENYGNGLNVSLQVLDGIICHNGEFAVQKLIPQKKTFKEFYNEYYLSYKNPEAMKKYVSMTLEGCIVRISDMIAYLGRDIDDATRMKFICFSDIPKDITLVLGNNTSDIIKTVVNDIIKNSFDKPYIKMSKDVYEAIAKLKEFNYKNIYNKALTEKEKAIYENMMRKVYDKVLKDLNDKNNSASVIKSYLKNMSLEYQKNSNEQIALDYVAGMTDDFLKNMYQELL